MQTWIFYPGKGDKRLIEFSKSGDIIGDIYVIEKREDVPSCEPPVLFLTAGARVFGVETVLKSELETASAKLRPNQTEAEAHAFVTKRCPKRKNIFAPIMLYTKRETVTILSLSFITLGLPSMLK